MDKEEKDITYKLLVDNYCEDYIYGISINKYKELQQENQQLKDNWNKLKEWIKSSDEHYPNAIPFRQTLRVMQELESGDK